MSTQTACLDTTNLSFKLFSKQFKCISRNSIFYPTTFNDFKSIFRRSIKKYIHQCLLSYKSHVILNSTIACLTVFLHSQIKRRMVKRENIHSVYTLRPIVLNVVLTLIIWSEGLVNENRLKSISCFLRRGNLPIRKSTIISYYLYLYISYNFSLIFIITFLYFYSSCLMKS